MARFSVPDPCPRRWTELQGDGRARFCDTCQMQVHAISEYSPEEWETLRRESGGHVCGLLNEQSAPEPRTRRAVLMGALLTAISPLMAQSGRVRIVVMDRANEVIPKAEIELLGPDGKPVRSQRTDENGVSHWSELPIGESKFRIAQMGFKTKLFTVVTKNSDEASLEITLEVGAVGEVITVVVPPV